MSDEKQQNAACLLKLQIGPVQEFIAQARSTRDLWSGSYLLSWLIAAGIRKLLDNGGGLVFPNPKGQPLLENPESWRELKDHTQILTPNLPNLFVAKIPSAGAKAKELADEIQKAIEDEWEKISEAVWKHQDCIAACQRDRFEHQVKRFLSISWQVTPLNENDYATAYKQNNLQLDATRQTRNFKAWSAGATVIGTDSNKDSLTGKEEFIDGGPGFAKRIKEDNSKYAFLFKHNDWIGAITLIKRVWHLAYLNDRYGLNTAKKEFRILSTRAIAGKSEELDDDENMETATGEKYFAVLALDGDAIGKWLNGDFLGSKDALAPYHANFSAALSDFALRDVRDTVQKHNGFLIYAGGDDVLALLPADQALECAQGLRTKFQAATQKVTGKAGERMDASAGIAIAHFKSPLQDVIRSAQAAEKRAKNQHGRSAVAVTLFKRSGETIEWGTQWNSHGLEIYRHMAEALEQGKVSSRFPYRIVGLLGGYLTETTPLSVKAVERVQDFNAEDVMERELAHAIDRHGTTKDAKANLRNMWLEPMGDPANANHLRRFLHWATKQEARTAARKLAEKLTTLAGGKPDSPEVEALCDLADMPIRDDSTHRQDFRVLATKLAGTGGQNDPARKAANQALESFEKYLSEAQLQALIGLCQTVAFAHRIRDNDAEHEPGTQVAAERQPV